MISFYFKTSKEESFSEVPELKEGSWIHVDEANRDDLDKLSKLTGIDYVDLQDCLDKYEIPRIEQIHNHILIFTRTPVEHESGLYTSTLTIIVTHQFFITISPYESIFIKNFLGQKTKIATHQTSKLLFEVLFKITQEYNFQIRKVRQNVLSQEKEMINVDSDDITALTKHEEILNQYLATLEPLRTVLQEIIAKRYVTLFESEKEKERIEDLRNAISQSEELCSIVIKSIRSLRDSYQIIFTNNLHKTIKLLTALTIIFNIPTMIASIYGMNINLPLEGSSHAFLILILIIAFLSFVGLLLFKRKKWL